MNNSHARHTFFFRFISFDLFPFTPFKFFLAIVQEDSPVSVKAESIFTSFTCSLRCALQENYFVEMKASPFGRKEEIVATYQHPTCLGRTWVFCSTISTQGESHIVVDALRSNTPTKPGISKLSCSLFQAYHVLFQVQTTPLRCCCHPDRMGEATAPMLKSRVSTLFKHTLGSYTAIKDKEIWEGTSNPSLHYLW